MLFYYVNWIRLVLINLKINFYYCNGIWSELFCQQNNFFRVCRVLLHKLVTYAYKNLKHEADIGNESQQTFFTRLISAAFSLVFRFIFSALLSCPRRSFSYSESYANCYVNDVPISNAGMYLCFLIFWEINLILQSLLTYALSSHLS